MFMLTMCDMNSRIVFIPQHQRELNAGVPVLRRVLLPGVLEVERGMLNVISIGEKEYPPASQGCERAVCTSMRLFRLPWRSAALEGWPVLPFLKLPPVLDRPCMPSFVQSLQIRVFGEDASHHCRDCGKDIF